MCTLSWVPSGNGYTVFFNRDEQLRRAPERAPVLREAGGVRAIAPVDGEAGGAWIGVNEFGLTVAALNRYDAPGEPATPRSRGLLVLDLLVARSAAHAEELLRHADLPAHRPVTLAVLEPGAPLVRWDWDGSGLARADITEAGLALTTSSVEPERVVASRRRAAELLMYHGAPSPTLLESVHRSHYPELGATSICMHRADAETRSLTRVRVGGDQVALAHWPEAPCRRAEWTELTLPRRERRARALAGT